jgi:hypothetical protein
MPVSLRIHKCPDQRNEPTDQKERRSQDVHQPNAEKSRMIAMTGDDRRQHVKKGDDGQVNRKDSVTIAGIRSGSECPDIKDKKKRNGRVSKDALSDRAHHSGLQNLKVKSLMNRTPGPRPQLLPVPWVHSRNQS